ncbi:MAG TPA: glutathione peroxidase, partial [Flavobacterium sp.]|nr:glutathione peroxidase [Flavobacterium sp.]
EKRNGNVEAPVKWNFQKFLINEKGEVVRSLQPTESVMADEVLKWIES